MTPRLLDLFCGAGGCSVGYERAGFDVVGVDIRPQPRYPFAHITADALDVLDDLVNGRSQLLPTNGLPFAWGSLSDFDAIHASPPCQSYSSITIIRGKRADHPDLIEPTRELLRATGLPYVIENVAGAPVARSAILCGSSFGLGVRRHRLFETSFPLLQPECRHREQGTPLAVYGHPGGGESSRRRGKEKKGSTGDWREAMGIDWMSAAELAQAIPPAYTEWIGGYLMAEVKARAEDDAISEQVA